MFRRNAWFWIQHKALSRNLTKQWSHSFIIIALGSTPFLLCFNYTTYLDILRKIMYNKIINSRNNHTDNRRQQQRFSDNYVHWNKIYFAASRFLFIVPAPPTPLKIVAIEGSAPHLPQLVCKTAAFYPMELDVMWQRNNVEILTGIETVRNRTADGLYEASSFLHDTQPAPGKTVYTCLVSHVSLTAPASFSYIVEQGKPGGI